MKGNTLEKSVNKVNLRYRLEKSSLILKVPTPIILTSNGLHAEQSTVDFTGVIQGGKYIAFDAKETKIKTRLDLKNLHKHQIDYLEMVKNLGGIVFFLVWFYEVHSKEAFIVPLSLIHKTVSSGKKSIPYKELEEASLLVPLDDYLTFLNNDEFTKKLFI